MSWKFVLYKLISRFWPPKPECHDFAPSFWNSLTSGLASFSICNKDMNLSLKLLLANSSIGKIHKLGFLFNFILFSKQKLFPTKYFPVDNPSRQRCILTTPDRCWLATFPHQIRPTHQRCHNLTLFLIPMISNHGFCFLSMHELKMCFGHWFDEVILYARSNYHRQ